MPCPQFTLFELKGFSIAPGERFDLIIDFSGLGGKSVILKNDNFNVMQFRVAQSGTRDSSPLPHSLRPVPKLEESTAVKTRLLSLVEVDDFVQRPMTMLLNNAQWSMPITENPVFDSTEIWTFVNTTDDAHSDSSAFGALPDSRPKIRYRNLLEQRRS